MKTMKTIAAVATFSLTLASTQVLAEMQTETVEYKICGRVIKFHT